MADESEVVALLREIRDGQREQLAFLREARADAARQAAERRRAFEEQTAATVARIGRTSTGARVVALAFAGVMALLVVGVLYLTYLKLGH